MVRRAATHERLSTSNAVTPVAFARAIVEAYRRYGRDPAAALKAAQIAPALLRRPDARMSAWQMEALSAHAMQELDDEALGWFDRRLPWGSYGLLARASLTAPDLGIALARWCRHHSLLADDISITLATVGDDAELAIEECRPLADAMREICMVTTLRNALGLSSWFIDSRIGLRSAAFAYAEPTHADAYAVLFPAPERRFDAVRTAVRFDAAYLAQPLRRDEAAMRQMLRRALPLTVLHYRRDRLLVQQVRQAFAAEPAHTAESLAQRLHMSVRTLHRQLREEGASLQSLKDAGRREAATALLLRTRKPIKQIAAAVGFRSEKSFIRAFRGWQGMAPGEFRAAPGTG